MPRLWRILLAFAGLAVACSKRADTVGLVDAGPVASVSIELDASAAPPAESLLGDAEVVRRSFRLRRVTLRIADMHMSRALDEVVRASETAVFATNGGFFDPQGEPLGLALSNGRVLSRATKKPGGVLLVDDEYASLEDAETFTLPTRPAGFGIQCLPRLVVNGTVNVHSDDGKHADRVALCLRGDGAVLDVVFARDKSGAGLGPTLHRLAEYLRATDCANALNLDGGPSAGIAWRDGNTIQSMAPRGPVRHAIVIHTTDGPRLPP